MTEPGWRSLPALIAALLLAGSHCDHAPARAEEDPSKLEFRPGEKKPKDVALQPLPEEPRKEREPPAPLTEVAGAFTECTAAHVLRLELARRISVTDAGRATGKKWAEYSRSQALLDRFTEGIARDEACGGEASSVPAGQIMKLYRTVIEYPDMRRRAAALAPLTLSTAAEAGRLLDRVKGILDGRQPGPVLDRGKGGSPAPDDPARQLEAEFERRARLLAETLDRLTRQEGSEAFRS
jgi:hypothetical protein